MSQCEEWALALPNINALFCGLLIEELRRSGVSHVFICPGSRSTPLTAAVASSRVPHTVVIDERGAAYAAVGFARATGKCAAVIVTSGTAVANLLPATVEATTDRVPLLLLTADRPAELRDTGANQTVTQPGMLTCLRWFKDLPCPAPTESVAAWLSDAGYAVHCATMHPAGPVHLNFMFREPLAPSAEAWPLELLQAPAVCSWLRKSSPFTRYFGPAPACPCTDAVSEIANLLKEARQGLVVAGALRSDADRLAAVSLSRCLNWPLLPDINSGVRAFSDSDGIGDDGVVSPSVTGNDHVVPLYDLLLSVGGLAKSMTPDVVVMVGGRLVSKRLQALVRARGVACVLLEAHPERHDPELCVTHRLHCDVSATVCALCDALDDDGHAAAATQRACAEDAGTNGEDGGDAMANTDADTDVRVTTSSAGAPDERACNEARCAYLRRLTRTLDGTLEKALISEPVAALALTDTDGHSSKIDERASASRKLSEAWVARHLCHVLSSREEQLALCQGMAEAQRVSARSASSKQATHHSQAQTRPENTSVERSEARFTPPHRAPAYAHASTLSSDGVPRPRHLLFCSSSLPIRHLDMYCARTPLVLSNRGASGIDGVVHCAFGAAIGNAANADAANTSRPADILAAAIDAATTTTAAAAACSANANAAATSSVTSADAATYATPVTSSSADADAPATDVSTDGAPATEAAAASTTLLIGDVAMAHDMSSLALLAACTLSFPFVVVILNNGGGGIFSYLPIAKHQRLFSPYFDTAHALRFEGACAGFGLPYVQTDGRAAFEEAYAAALARRGVSVIEAVSVKAETHQLHQRLCAIAADVVREQAGP